MNTIVKAIMKTALTPYIRYKVKDMILEEVKAMNDENYSSPYFQEEIWNAGAWQVHRGLKKALIEIKTEMTQYIEENAPTLEKKEEALKKLENLHFIIKNGTLKLEE